MQNVNIFIGLEDKLPLEALTKAVNKVLAAHLETLQNLRKHMDSLVDKDNKPIPAIGYILTDKFKNEHIWTQEDDTALNAEIAELEKLVDDIS